jgi:hypothetical protein
VITGSGQLFQVTKNTQHDVVLLWNYYSPAQLPVLRGFVIEFANPHREYGEPYMMKGCISTMQRVQSLQPDDYDIYVQF